jgi:hypothetical protein
MIGTSSDTGEDLDSEVRELMLLQLQTYARDAIKELHSIQQEIVLLDHMADLRELDELKGTGGSSSGSSSSSSSSGGAPGSRQGPPGLPSSDAVAPKAGEGPGISITRTSVVDGQLVMSNDVVRAQTRAEVFQPRMSGPTMTLEEFGDRDLARLKEREEKSAAAAADTSGQPPRRLPF